MKFDETVRDNNSARASAIRQNIFHFTTWNYELSLLIAGECLIEVSTPSDSL